MKKLNLVQGTTAWLEARANYLTASEAPAMLGLSKYVSRDQLLYQKKTGILPEIDFHLQRRFDEGHETEAKARPIAEKIAGDDFFPVTGLDDSGRFLASLDGLTEFNELAFEHKTWNKEFAAQVKAGIVPDTHWPQLEHQMIVSEETTAVMFVVSDGTEDNFEYCFYESVPERRKQVIQGWDQFQADLETYEAPAPVAAKAEFIPKEVAIPTLQFELNELDVNSNIEKVIDRLDDIAKDCETELKTDDDFANRELLCKQLDGLGKKLKAGKDHLLSNLTSINSFMGRVDYAVGIADKLRLTNTKLIKAEKENRKLKLVQAGEKACQDHFALQDLRLGKWNYSPSRGITKISEAIKGKRNLDSMESAVNDAVAHYKIEINQYIDGLYWGFMLLDNASEGYEFLFNDLATFAGKDEEYIAAIASQRITEYKAAEQKKIDDALAAEEARKQKEIDDQAEAERLAAESSEAPVVEPINETAAYMADNPPPSSEGMPNYEERQSENPAPDNVVPAKASLIEDLNDWAIRNHVQPKAVNELVEIFKVHNRGLK